LQWGSNSDLCRGDGAVLPQSFPFECDIPASVDDPTTFETSMTELRVDDGGWRDSMHDE
jgi:predicted pPIWI-associating nuclease